MKLKMVDRDTHTSQVRDIYEKEAEQFDTKAPKLLTWVHIVEPAINRNLESVYKNAKKIRVLDIGCADGRVIDVHLGNGVLERNITGVELSDKQVQISKGKYPKAKIQQGDISKTKLPNGKFDLVTSIMVFEFLTADQFDDALSNIYGATKPGGSFFYVVTHPARVEGKYGLSPEHEGQVMTTHPWGSEEYPNWHRGVDRYIRQTEAAGFKVTKVEELEMPQGVQDEHPEFKSFNAPARLIVLAHRP